MTLATNLTLEITNVTGTGDATISSATGDNPPIFTRRFSDSYSTGSENTFWYSIRHRSALEWEVGIGYLSDANTLVRDTVIQSSNSDALVDFSAGIKDVVSDVPAYLQNKVEKQGVLTASDPALGVRDSHTIFTNTGASALVSPVLPAAAVDLRFTFIVTDSNGFGITADGSDTINIGGSSGSVQTSTQAGSAVSLIGETGGWFASSALGTWIET